MATQGEETLAELVANAAGVGRQYTFAALSEQCLDPETGYRPSANLLWKISRGESVKVNPALIRAVASGLGLPLARVAEAATRQFIGYVVDDPFAGRFGGGVSVVHGAEEREGDLPRAREFIEGVLGPEPDNG